MRSSLSFDPEEAEEAPLNLWSLWRIHPRFLSGCVIGLMILAPLVTMELLV
jgi:hypothetical protein